MDEDLQIPMAAAVVRVMKELREPLERHGYRSLFDAFEKEYRHVLQADSRNSQGERFLVTNENGAPVLPDSLLGIYLELCQAIDADPYGGEVGEDA